MSQETIKLLREELAVTREDLAHARGELEPLRAQHVLDTEDRVTLRALLRVARKQQSGPDWVHVLYRFGAVHSVHATRDAAASAAEDEGAAPGGWTSQTRGGDNPQSAAEAPWRIEPLTLGRVK
ncbi:hypothetical protein [Streptomyces niveus]|uniref:hypothetical protein n=1 Tax=Streptomyces niveus TaxID=193462 RepID=UPI0034479B7C